MTLVRMLFLAVLVGLAGCKGPVFSSGQAADIGSVGAVLGKDNRDGRLFVREAPSDMPAAQAGILLDDEVVEIDGRVARDLTADEVHQALAGPAGSDVELRIRRGGQIHKIVVRRARFR